MKGIDVSNHNGNINWSKVKADGVEVVYIKATEGTTYQDQWLNSHYAGAKGVGLSTGFYHFLVGTSQPESQAHNFYNQIKDKKNDLIPCLDIEVSGFDVGDYAIRFLKKFKELSGMGMVIYTGAYFSRDNLPMEIKKNYPLWLAHYGVEPWKSNLVALAGFTILAGHQYTEKGHINGINTNVDMNVFNESIFLDKSNISINNTDSSDWLAEYLKSWNWSEWVGKLQRTVGVNVDKIVGPITLKACTLLKKGCTGELVKRLQEILKAYGFNCGNIDGILGDKTYNAVVAFQKSRGLAIDGVVGYNTWKALLGL
ncbi:MAG TPA: glycosyl hydrolase [Gallicola sp.]|nr:glycosyl hydrolase [Gallicola sp.]